jgi:hypothetical protein
MPPSDHSYDGRKSWMRPSVDPGLAINYWEDGMDTFAISTRLNVHESVVYNFLSRYREWNRGKKVVYLAKNSPS